MSNQQRTLDDPDVEPFDRRVLEDIRDYGYHVVAVASADSVPAWAYTVGFGTTFNHPEIVAFGLDVRLMHSMLRNVATEIENGRPFHDRTQSSEIVSGYACTFRHVHVNWFPTFLGYARWFYRGDDFECLQCFWPDRHHRLPWDTEFERGRILQPILYEPDLPSALTHQWIIAQTDA
ncbi:MAG: DUF4262 domain-containing protein [Polyangiaceae bacterium]